MAYEGMFVVEGEQYAREGEVLVFTLTWSGLTTVSSGVTTAYRSNSDESATLLSGSEVTSGNVQTLRTLTIPSGYGGSTIVLEAKVDSGSQTLKTGITIRVMKVGQEE